MTDIFQQIVASLVTTGTVGAVLIWFLKKYVDSKLNLFFELQAQKSKSDLELAAKFRERLLDVSTNAIAEIQQVVYRSRNLLRDAIGSKDAFFASQFRSYCYHLTENLYQYQLYLPKSTFEMVHQYKEVVQDVVLIIDSTLRLTSSSTESDSTTFKQLAFEGEALDQCKRKYEEVDRLYKAISDALRQSMTNPSKTLV